MSDQSALAERLHFIGLDAKAKDDIRSLKPVIDMALPAILEDFYGKIGSVPDVARFFADESRVSHAKGAQLNHWSRISSADFSADYLDSSIRIGKTHARIGLEPRWYVGGYALLLADLAKVVLAANWPKGLFGGRQGHEQAADAMGALIKAVFLDMELAISTYIDAADAARKAAEDANAAAAQKQAAVVEALTRNLALLAQGDLTCRLPETFPAEYQALKSDFDSAVEKLNEAIGSISVVAREVIDISGEISSATATFSERTEGQAASLEQTSSSMEQIAATVKNNAENAQRANGLAQGTRELADRGGSVVSEAVTAMARIEEASQKIADIISVIDEIARQTNLLALNAAVEAARAGEAGRGFAVVASEVRSLAQRSSQAAKDIKGLIVNSSSQVQDGVQLVRRTGNTLEEIMQSIIGVADIVADIATASGEQAVGIDQVNTALTQIDQTTQQNAAMVEENLAAARMLDQQAGTMVERIGRFKLSGQAAVAPRAQAAPASSAAPRRAPLAKKSAIVPGTARKMQAALAAAVKQDDWEEF